MSGSPTAHAVDAKTKRYDRQLRIWGPHGQQALEGARICLLNAGAQPSLAARPQGSRLV